MEVELVGVFEREQCGLVYAADITIGDVEAIDSFLIARTARSAGAERGSNERQVARSVRAALVHVVGTLQHALPLSGETADDVDAQRYLRLQVQAAWNTLWVLASPWQSHSAYDHERWRHVKYWDAEQEAAGEAHLVRALDHNSNE
ncbi:hypothetical protein [Streptomyces sp. ICBB 8177]|uniref:hypothetical protein n=1 Tax=Streptomyces sp. ICBB 8177 TaxID=563922 RepID=UPI0011B53FEF|nr:hypothetical protein [Streptomyces sp. ICBB 8177]